MKHMLTAAALVIASTATATAEQSNLQVALDAARKMEWTYENKPFLLIKRETIRATVGLIFGYADNKDACEDIALALSQSGTEGTFVCDAVY